MTTPEDGLLKQALGLLARREYARAELRTKLASRGADPEAVEALLDRLADTGAQSDRRFTEEFVRLHIGRGEGPYKIMHALEARRIARELIDEMLAQPDTSWITLAERARVKRFGSPRPTDGVERERQSRFLLQRGFAPEVVSGLWQSWGLDALTTESEWEP